MASTALQRAGFEIIEANDGTEGLDVLRDSGNGIDLLLTDVQMPRMDGVSLAESARKLFPRLPIVFMSGYADPAHVRPPKGSVFLSKPFRPKVLVEAVRELIAAENLGRVTIPDVGPAHILIVDDRPDNLLVMQSLLEDYPEYDVVTASSGAEAIELVKKIDFALILLDVLLPGMDGFETAASIKQLQCSKDIPIMMVTAIECETPEVLKGYSAGAIDYIARPFHPAIFKAKVGVYANLHIKARQVAAQTKHLLEAHQALRQADRTTSVLEGMPAGLVVADPAGTIFRVNLEAKRIWGGARMAAVGDYKELLGWWPENGEPLKPDEWPLVRAVEKGETSLHAIINIRSLDGMKRTILDSAAPLRNTQGDVTGAVDVMLDVTHQERLRETVRT
jgi:PAS domain S-box-containing protein